MVDAAMRSLRATGWLPFRLRAMVVSFAANHLWLDWRAFGQPLAQRFIDYEPGIHWGQCQHFSGVTGAGDVTIDDPVKLGRAQDPGGSFIRKWVPELEHLPVEFLHEPWTMTPLEQAETGVEIGEEYPVPVVDLETAAQGAMDRIKAIRDSDTFAEEGPKVLLNGHLPGLTPQEEPGQEITVEV